MLHFFKRHWLGDKLDLDLLALFKHALRCGRSTSIDVNVDILILHLLKLLVDGCHEAAKQESRVIQVHKDETVRRVFADRAAH